MADSAAVAAVAAVAAIAAVSSGGARCDAARAAGEMGVEMGVGCEGALAAVDTGRGARPSETGAAVTSVFAGVGRGAAPASPPPPLPPPLPPFSLGFSFLGVPGAVPNAVPGTMPSAVPSADPLGTTSAAEVDVVGVGAESDALN